MANLSDRFFSFIIRHRKWVLSLAMIAFLACGTSLFGIRINSDLAEYLPDDSTTKTTVNLLSEHFHIYGDAKICVEGELTDYARVSLLAEQLAGVKNVDAVGWLGAYAELFTIDNGAIQSANEMIPDANIQALASQYHQEANGKGYYLFAVSLSVSNVHQGASEAMDEIKGILNEYAQETGADTALGGNAMQGKQMIDSALGELPYFLILAVAAISVILLLTNKSVMGALIFMITIGASIVYNLGTNVFTDSISTVTFSVAAVLQLALSMDYSIFLTHAYERAKEENRPNPMFYALKRTSVTIFASSLTTVAGFCALFFMRYTMGFDLGLCLAKGTLLSLLSVIILQPCLMITFQKACEKTCHRALSPSFERFSRFPGRSRVAALLLVVLITVPAIYLSAQLGYYYLETDYSETSTGAKGVLDAGGTQAVFVVPVRSNDEQLAFLETLKDLKAEGKLSSVTGYYAMMDALTNGIRIPLYASSQDQAEGKALTTLTLATKDVLAIAETGALDEETTVAITNEVAAALLNRVPAMVDAQAAQIQSESGKALNRQERATLTTQIVSALQTEAKDAVRAQTETYLQQFAAFAGRFEEMKEMFIAEIDGVPYTYYALSIAGAPEGAAALASIEEIENAILTRFQNGYFAAGNTQAVRDMAAVTGQDFIVVNIVSAILILLILCVTFKGFRMPVLMVALIELAILINLSVSTLTGGEINFMTYVVISAIQLGATIDYAILLIKTFREKQAEGLSRLDAVAAATKSSAFSILISMAILSSACLSVYFISSDTIIREVTSMLARGSMISAFMVLVVFPGLLSLKRKP